MKQTVRTGLLIIVLASLVLTLAVCASAIADSSVPARSIVSLSLNGIETKGITYTIMEITRQEDRLEVKFLHEPNEENVTLIDVFDYFNSDSQSEEWKHALLFGEHVVGSSCDVRLLLPKENKELSCHWGEGTGGDGGSIITKNIFDESIPTNLDDVTLLVRFSFFENTERENEVSATLMLPLSGIEK